MWLIFWRDYINAQVSCGEVILFFVTIIAASGWFFSKFALAEFPPIGFMGGRFLLAFLIYLPFAYSQFSQNLNL